MSECKQCGEDHVESAARAALAFERILRLMADEKLEPSVMLHVTGLLGALLAHHAPYELDEVLEEIRRAAEDTESVQGMYDNLVAMGLIEPDAPAH